jgi:hypothetical protein
MFTTIINKGENKTLLYLSKQQLDKEADGINMLKAFESSFKRNALGLIIIDFKKVLNIPHTKEGLYIEEFLNRVLFMQYDYLIID